MKKNVLILLFFTLSYQCFSQYNEKDTINLQVLSWKLDKTNEQVFYNIDSTLNEFQYCSPQQKQSFYNFTNGRILTPAMSIVYIKQPSNYSDFLFSNYYQQYLLRPNDIKYYKTKKPYTDFFYNSAQKKKGEQILNIIHTQNINSKTNVGVNYNLLTAKDFSNSSSNQNSTSNSLVVWGSHVGKRYTIHTGLIQNKLKIYENGGMLDTGAFDKDNITYFFNNGFTRLSDNNIYLVQEYKLGKTKVDMVNDTTFNETFIPKSVISHTFNYQNSYHTFYKNTLTDLFFVNNNFNQVYTYDSVHYSKILNAFQLKSKQFDLAGLKLNGRIGFENNILSFYNFKEYLSLNKNVYKTNNFLLAGINNLTIKSFNADFNFKYCLMGYNFADLEFEAKLNKNFNIKTDSAQIKILFNYSHTEPSYFIQTYYSNHNQWNTKLKKQKNISLSLLFDKPNNYLNFEINTRLIYDFIYFDTLATPSQYSDILNINTIYVSKEFHFAKITSLNKIVYQNISNKEVLSLPDFVILNSTYLTALILKKSLNIQIGFDIYYTTKFNAYNYNPSTSILYLNNKVETGNYPILNAFLKMKLKNSLLFFELEHVNGGMFADYYSTINHYHVSQLFYRFGVKWWFRD